MCDSTIKEELKKLCGSNGWCYGIFWGFDQRNSLLLTLKDAYCEEQMVPLVDNMLLQVHVVGGGVIGQTAFIKNCRWMFADGKFRNHNSLGSFQSLVVFQDDSDFYCQFSMGIKTIALISVEPWGVVQLGSAHVIPERTDFVDQVKQAFKDMAPSLRILEQSQNEPSSSASKSFDSNQQFSSLLSCDISCSVNQNFQQASNSETLIEPNHSSVINPSQSFPSPFDNQITNSLFTSSSVIENQILLGSDSATQLDQLLLSESGNFFGFCSDTQQAHISHDSSLLTSFRKSQTPSGLLSMDDLFQENSLSKHCPMDDDLSKWFSSQTCSSNTSSLTGLLDNAVSHVTGLVPVSNLENLPTNSIQSSITDAFMLNEEKCSDASSINKMIFGSLGAKSEYNKSKQGLDRETLIPVVSGDHGSCFNTNKVRTTSESLFSKLGLDQLLEGSAAGGSGSLSKSSFEDQSSKRRKIDNCSWSPYQVKMQCVSDFDQGTKSLDHKTSNNNIMDLDSVASMKNSGSCIGGNTSSLKRQEEAEKAGKKKAKPGTRPRPKDRQMIQDRLAELRHLIPNGEKMSIDRLLERTIRHMNFMQSLSKHSESMKKMNKPKTEASVPKENFSNIGAGVTWACEVEDQTMVCPLIVEDLSAPGQMLIEMLCEEQGFLLEIVDIIRGFGLIVSKGVMEVRETKIWAHFIVEAEGDRRITRHEIFSSLIQLLQMTGQGAANSSNHHLLGKVSSSSASLFDYCQADVPFPANVVDTLQCANS